MAHAAPAPRKHGIRHVLPEAVPLRQLQRAFDGRWRSSPRCNLACHPTRVSRYASRATRQATCNGLDPGLGMLRPRNTRSMQRAMFTGRALLAAAGGSKWMLSACRRAGAPSATPRAVPPARMPMPLGARPPGPSASGAESRLKSCASNSARPRSYGARTASSRRTATSMGCPALSSGLQVSKLRQLPSASTSTCE